MSIPVKIGMRRADMEHLPHILIGGPTYFKHGISWQNVILNDVVYEAKFQIEGNRFVNPGDILISFEVDDTLRAVKK